MTERGGEKGSEAMGLGEKRQGLVLEPPALECSGTQFNPRYNGHVIAVAAKGGPRHPKGALCVGTISPGQGGGIGGKRQRGWGRGGGGAGSAEHNPPHPQKPRPSPLPPAPAPSGLLSTHPPPPPPALPQCSPGSPPWPPTAVPALTSKDGEPQAEAEDDHMSV